jgi:UDP-N-acetylglucosamine--N-acetylmuramyl-(pentapeptide) pyrophosphoryl-undecaprenol N-acetylglucosamine transferase
MTGPIRIVLSGGISGGHIFPLLAVAKSIEKKSPVPVECMFIGSRGKFESDAMEAAGIPLRFVATGKWRRYASFQNFLDLFKIPIGFVEALWHLFWFMPNAVFAKGGSASVPVVLAAWVYRIPVVIHDSDARAGAANIFLSRFASRVAVSYESAREFFPREKTALTGNPVRPEIIAGQKERALSTFNLKENTKTLLVIGGSQGARSLNEHLLKILPTLIEKGIQVVHVTGENNFEEIIEATTHYGLDVQKGLYRPISFVGAEPLGDLYALSDIVLSRAGAATIAELAATKKASILVPLSTAANNHQHMNAYEVAERGAAIMIEEPNLTEHLLLQYIEELLNSEENKQKLGQALGNVFYHQEAADRIAVVLLELSVA